MKRIRHIFARAGQSFRDWQEPSWDFQPLKAHSWEYRLYVVVVIPMSVLAALFTADLVGVDFGVQSTMLVMAGTLLAALLSPLVIRADDNTTVDVVAAVPIAMLLAGEITGAIAAITVSMLVYALKTPLPAHQTFMFNTLGVGVWGVLVASITMEVVAGSSSVLSPMWLAGAYAATLVYFASMIYPTLVGNVIGDYATVRGTLDTWRSTVRTEFLTLSTIAVIGAAAIHVGGWWYIFVAITPILTAWETYRRTNQYALARSDAEHDPLTGLYNRRALEHELAAAISAATPMAHMGRRNQDDLGAWLVLGDLDNFKRLNDVFGHATGDEALVKAAQVLVESTRVIDTCARLGGEEFVVVLRDLHEVDALSTAERLRVGTFEALKHLDTSMSIGVYRITSDESAETALHKADMAMYAAKTAGKNQVRLWTTDLAEDADDHLADSADQPAA